MNVQTRVLPGRTVASLALALLATVVLVAALALSLAAKPAHSQFLAASPDAAPAAISQEAEGAADDAVPLASLAPNATTCSAAAVDYNITMPNPPGQKVKIVGEDEINIAFHWDTGGANLQTAKLDLSGTSLVSSTVKYTGPTETSVGWLAMTTADLNRTNNNTTAADSTDEVVTVFRDSSSRLSVVSSASPTTPWYSDSASEKNPAYIDIAAGNLDRSKDPADDEVVVTFQDANYDLRVIALDGNTAGGIGTAANSSYGLWSNSEHGRGNVEFNAIATGDFNGDGYNDEIVTVFEDSDDDLHTVGLRREANGSMTMLWQKWWDQGDRGDVVDDSETWTNTRTPMDVTTGDVDGDMKDEIIFAYRIGDSAHGTVELMVLDPNGDTKGTAAVTDDTYTLDDSVFWNHPLKEYSYMAALAVSVSAADLDGDDEIALGYNSLNDDTDHGDRYWQHYLVSYEYVPPASPKWAVCLNTEGVRVSCNCVNSRAEPVACLQQRPGKWTPGRVHMNQSDEESTEAGRVNIDTGDIDGDGFAEIVYARHDYSSRDLYTYVFDAEKGTATPSITHRYYSYGKGVWDFWLALADRDGNAKWATYQNVCVVKD